MSGQSKDADKLSTALWEELASTLALIPTLYTRSESHNPTDQTTNTALEQCRVAHDLLGSGATSAHLCNKIQAILPSIKTGLESTGTNRSGRPGRLGTTATPRLEWTNIAEGLYDYALSCILDTGPTEMQLAPAIWHWSR